MSRKITKSQVRALRTAASKVFPNDELYHDWLMNNFKVESTLELSNTQARRAIDLLAKETGFKSKRNYYGSGIKGQKAGPLTENQAKKIGALERLLGWERKQTLGFIRRQTGKLCDVQMLRNYEAQKVIVGMQRIAAGGDQKIYKQLNTMQITDPDSPVGKALIEVLKKKAQNKKG